MLSVQYQKNDGKCGVCGDNFADATPRAHETGGMFGNGIIGERFVMGQVRAFVKLLNIINSFSNLTIKTQSDLNAREKL
jgi:hypothetical protein